MLKNANIRQKQQIWLLAGILGLVACGIGAGLYYVRESRLPKLRMSAGSEFTRRHQVASYFCDQAKRNDIDIELVNNSGSAQSLRHLKSGELDLALVDNGVLLSNQSHVTVLGALQPEYVHVLVRKELAGSEPLPRRIFGKRVNLGERGSTELVLIRELLEFAHLKLPADGVAGDVVATDLSKDDLKDLCRTIQTADPSRKPAMMERLPDALLVVDSLPSTTVQSLLETGGYHLEPMPGARAFLLDNLKEHHRNRASLGREYLEVASIPAQSYFAPTMHPAADCPTIAFRSLLVARKDLSERAVRPLMKTLFEREFHHMIQPKSPRDVATPYAAHAGAVAYLDRDKPLPIKEAMDWVSESLSLLGAATAGSLSVYGLLRLKKVRKPADYYSEIREVERLAKFHTSQADQSEQTVSFSDLEARLHRLREELVEDICEGRIKGDQVIANILALLKEVRVNLPKFEATSQPSMPPSLRFEAPASRAA